MNYHLPACLYFICKEILKDLLKSLFPCLETKQGFESFLQPQLQEQYSGQIAQPLISWYVNYLEKQFYYRKLRNIINSPVKKK